MATAASGEDPLPEHSVTKMATQDDAVALTVSSNGSSNVNSGQVGSGETKGLWSHIKKIWPFHAKTTLEESVVELIEEQDPSRNEMGEEERALFHNLLRFHENTVEDIMVPRSDIVAVAMGGDLEALRQIAVESEHTRLPVYEENLDHIRGFVHTKDLIRFLGTSEPFDITQILRKLLMVPPSMKSIDLLVKMRIERVHMAMVIDEYGGVDGLLTIEDIMEELVGEIEDEHDDVEEPELIGIDEHTYEAKARLPIETLESCLGLSFHNEEEDDFDTLGGLLFNMLGRVPNKGERISHANGTQFRIVEADPRRIKRVLIHVPVAAPADDVVI